MSITPNCSIVAQPTCTCHILVYQKDYHCVCHPQLRVTQYQKADRTWTRGMVKTLRQNTITHLLPSTPSLIGSAVNAHPYCTISLWKGPVGSAPYMHIGSRPGGGPIFEVSLLQLEAKEHPGKLPTCMIMIFIFWIVDAAIIDFSLTQAWLLIEGKGGQLS